MPRKKKLPTLKTMKAWAWQEKSSGELAWGENQQGWMTLLTASTRADAFCQGVNKETHRIVRVYITTQEPSHE